MADIESEALAKMEGNCIGCGALLDADEMMVKSGRCHRCGHKWFKAEAERMAQVVSKVEHYCLLLNEQINELEERKFELR